MAQPPAIVNFAEQAEACAALGSPLTAALCRAVPPRLDPATGFGARLLAWPMTAGTDAVALRVAGAFHALVRSGRAPALAACYPPRPLDEPALAAALVDAMASHDAFLAAYLDSPPQTNEVGRSAVLLGGLLRLARDTGVSRLELLEIGSSAGLNLMLDAYGYELGGSRRRGPASAPLTLSSDWRGAFPPLDQPLEIAARAGCDRNPLDARRPETVERLLSYVWADQPQRMARLAAALANLARSDLHIETADAADWLDARLAAPQPEGTARIVFHSFVWQYLPDATRARIEKALAAAGASATPRTPLARLGFETETITSHAALRLTLWPEGATRTLAHADFHGGWAEWL